MTTIINADTITGGAIITGDASGNLALQSGGVTGLTVSSGGAVTFSGAVSGSNSTLTLVRGITYTFNLNASGHPFLIKTNLSIGTGNQYTTGVTNNGEDVGIITFTPPLGAPATLYYNCQLHSSMKGTINLVDVAFDSMSSSRFFSPRCGYHTTSIATNKF